VQKSLTLAIRLNPQRIIGTIQGQRTLTIKTSGQPTTMQFTLYLVPRDNEMRTVISLIRIGGSRDRVDLIEVHEANGDRSVMKVYEEVR